MVTSAKGVRGLIWCFLSNTGNYCSCRGLMCIILSYYQSVLCCFNCCAFQVAFLRYSQQWKKKVVFVLNKSDIYQSSHEVRQWLKLRISFTQFLMILKDDAVKYADRSILWYNFLSELNASLKLH